MDYDVQIEETPAYWFAEAMEEAEGNVPALPADAPATVAVIADDDLPF